MLMLIQATAQQLAGNDGRKRGENSCSPATIRAGKARYWRRGARLSLAVVRLF